ncbi:plastocyanin/azurin family copper-binding protein [Haloplanus halophilus]|uniref:plastocyanin/azurin family copper-binding protein n=1 Tax=Haloplanus halophilus TaxID=2949993 RepID=UPI00203A6443|nr:plastocyanin/azurin family copper-binding protein [Haloplanus sp. GDY1]
MVSKQSNEFLSRRKFAATFSSVVLAGLAGCSGGNGGGGGEATATATATDTPEPTATATATATSTPAPEPDATISVGPGGSLQFEPANTAVSQGDTVEWVFDSGGHNVSGHPDAASDVELPEGAEPFASYDISGENVNHLSLNAAGTSYYHTFETTGDYTYVCVPHVASGMIGQLTVR